MVEIKSIIPLSNMVKLTKLTCFCLKFFDLIAENLGTRRMNVKLSKIKENTNAAHYTIIFRKKKKILFPQ